MPHTDETFFKMRVGWREDPKVSALTRYGPVDACLAAFVFMEMIDYARAELTDGLVPGESLGQIAYPLAPDDAMRLAMLLADTGPFGPLVTHDASSNAFSILRYAKWNDTRAEVQARKDKAGKAARTRWEGAGARSIATRIPRALMRDAEQEQEQESPQSPPDAHSATRTDNGQGEDDDYEAELTQVQALMAAAGRPVGREDAATIRSTVMAKAGSRVRSPRAWIAKVLGDTKEARRYAPGAVHTAPTVKEVIAQAHRPGGPSADPPGRAAEARTQLMTRPRPLPTDAEPAPGDPTAGLHFEDLARTQLAESRAARAALEPMNQGPRDDDDVVDVEIVDDDTPPEPAPLAPEDDPNWEPPY